eukprot:TRINITY_DN1120_c1_g2_i4.p2 TRINITY_DN1120_c1_g2~~TRINITY_DN1120_c1_g2_i4.p2  ORF type:complete len:344 (+),score=95.89 TRINITY_DN1120_c1_g2_i4:99-1130(+)
MKKYLIVGGGGFLGRYIVEQLLARGETQVKVFDLRQSFQDNRVEFILGDITSVDSVTKACQGIDTVIHTASPAVGLKGTYSEEFIYAVNVLGTQNVIEACVSNNVSQLIYTSSASVIFEGKPLHLADESTPVSSNHLDPYSKTKAEAEKYVLEANGRKNLSTISLRPSGLFGPRDVQSWPGFIETAKQGKSKVMIGDGSNQFDWTYIENVAHAHLLASDKLTTGSSISGKAYFITNDDPVPFWSMANYIYSNFGYPTTKWKLPYVFIYQLAALFVFMSMLLSYVGIKWVPAFTPFRVANAGVNRTFSVEKAKKELGYRPLVSVEEGKKRTLSYFKQMRTEGKI